MEEVRLAVSGQQHVDGIYALIAVVVESEVDRCLLLKVARVVPRQEDVDGIDFRIGSRVAAFAHSVADIEDVGLHQSSVERG